MKLVDQKIREVINSDDLAGLDRGKTVLKISRSLWEGDNKIGSTQSHRITGINRHSGKRWFRWETTGGVYVHRSGKTGFFYMKEKSGGRWSSHVFLPDQVTSDLLDVFTEKWGQKPTFDSLYPMADNYMLQRPFNQFTPEYGLGWLRYPDAMHMTTAMFGKTRYRKDLVKSVAEASWAAVLVARQFRGLVPIDWIINFLKINERQPTQVARTYGQPNIDLRRQMLALDPRSYRALLRKDLSEDDQWHYLLDMARVINAPIARGAVEPVHGRVRNWREFHDLYVRRRGEWVPSGSIETRFDIPQTEIAQAIDGQMIGNLEIRTPKNIDDIRYWGEYMHNCIGGYGYLVACDNAKVTLGAIIEDGKVLANFEVRDGRLSQLLGRFNGPLPDDRRDPIVSALAAFDIDTSGSWWGQS
jgi:hypothetical protein